MPSCLCGKKAIDESKKMIPANKLELYEHLVKTLPSVERKGDTMPYTSLNGHMFSFLSASGTLAIRLSREERETFMEKYNATLMEAHGIVMKEYVAVPDELLKNKKIMKKYFQLSFNYVKGLKPKIVKPKRGKI